MSCFIPFTQTWTSVQVDLVKTAVHARTRLEATTARAPLDSREGTARLVCFTMSPSREWFSGFCLWLKWTNLGDLSVSMSFCACVSVSLCVCVSVSLCVCVSLCLCRFVSLSVSGLCHSVSFLWYQPLFNQCAGFDHCSSSPCLNGGVCINGFHGYTCRCQGNWIGINCGVLLQSGPFNRNSSVVQVKKNWNKNDC